MTSEATTSRRSILTGGMLLAVPFAGAAATVPSGGDAARARLARLEADAAIRALQARWLRRINRRDYSAAAALFADPRAATMDEAVRSITVADAGMHAIDHAADGRRATGRYTCIVETSAAIPQDCTLAQMAHAQGEGWVCAATTQTMMVDYVRRDADWAIAQIRFART